MSTDRISLRQHLDQAVAKSPGVDATVPAILARIASAGAQLAVEIRHAALTGQLGLAGASNITGDDQKKLDVLANDRIIDSFQDAKLASWLVSEELDEAVPVEGGAPFLLGIDPLDGSSNVDVNGDLGTIFGVYPQPKDSSDHPTLLPGSEQVAAGYILFGPGTMFVYTIGQGVHGFALDSETGEFYLTHEDIRCPSKSKIYSGNLANEPNWVAGIQKWAAAKAAATEPSCTLRYSGALVADFHRCLLKGGIYFYPADRKSPDGKLRLFYECAPLAFIAEAAGGRATTGNRRILDVEADTLHQRIPFIIGSSEAVSEYEDYFQRG